nr:MAG TPA: hypothetical protein [Caudoviricetes sp.]
MHNLFRFASTPLNVPNPLIYKSFNVFSTLYCFVQSISLPVFISCIFTNALSIYFCTKAGYQVFRNTRRRQSHSNDTKAKG